MSLVCTYMCLWVSLSVCQSTACSVSRLVLVFPFAVELSTLCNRHQEKLCRLFYIRFTKFGIYIFYLQLDTFISGSYWHRSINQRRKIIFEEQDIRLDVIFDNRWLRAKRNFQWKCYWHKWTVNFHVKYLTMQYLEAWKKLQIAIHE